MKLQRDAILCSELSAVKEALDKAGVSWVVFAGAAAQCYGSKREITDIDILVKRKDLGKAKSLLKNVGKEHFDVVAGSDQIRLDDEMVKRTRHRPLFGVTVPVIPVEDNIILKAILQRGEDQGKHDIDDVKSMIRNENIDLEYLNWRIREWKVEERVKPLLQSFIPNML